MNHALLSSSLFLSVTVVLLNSPNLSPYFAFNRFERTLLLIFISLLCLINSHFSLPNVLFCTVLCKENFGCYSVVHTILNRQQKWKSSWHVRGSGGKLCH